MQGQRKSKLTPAADINWDAVQNDFRTGAYTLKQLQDKYHVWASTISQRARKGKWKKDLKQSTEKLAKEIVHKENKTIRDTGLNATELHGPMRTLLADTMPPESPAEAVAQVAARQAAVRLMMQREAESVGSAITTGFDLAKDLAKEIRGNLKDDPGAYMMYGKLLKDATWSMDKRHAMITRAHQLDTDDRSAGNAPLNITINLRRGQSEDDDTINITPGKDKEN